MTERADQDPISTPAMVRQSASDYLAGADPKTPLASPLFASRRTRVIRGHKHMSTNT